MTKKYRFEDFEEFLKSPDVDTIKVGLVMMSESIDILKMSKYSLKVLERKIDSLSYNLDYEALKSNFHRTLGDILKLENSLFYNKISLRKMQLNNQKCKKKQSLKKKLKN